jgi:hypothetical protein
VPAPHLFRNSLCLECGAALGFEPDRAEVRALRPGPKKGIWLLHGEPPGAPAYRHCENLHTPAGCNWLLPADHPSDLCIACRLNRTIPDLSDADNCH